MPLSRRRLLAATPAVVAAACVQTPKRTTDVREVTATLPAQPTKDGAGVKLSRILGGRALPMLDPFLLLDEFHSNRPEDFERGFPSHPHRGFETVTIMLDGEVAHKDSVGNSGVIGAGAVQWMTAGKGIIHSEMPRAAAPGGDLWGYQLWVNLPARAKMTKPRYQEIGAASFPSVSIDDARARLLAGTVGVRKGPIDGVLVDPVVLDASLEAGARMRHDLPRGHSLAIFVIQGGVKVGAQATAVSERHIAVLGEGTTLDVTADKGARVLVLAAAPIGEPVARRGPFVMNTDDELRQAFDDYRSGRLTEG